MTTANLYQQIIDLPETLIGEILNGRLYIRRVGLPGRHAVAKMALTMRLFLPFDSGRDGPGGWRLISRMEIHRLAPAADAGAARGVLDWVCEILTQEIAETVRNIKMPMYLQRGIRHAWLLEPDAQTLAAFEAGEGAWRLVGQATGDNMTRPWQPVMGRGWGRVLPGLSTGLWPGAGDKGDGPDLRAGVLSHYCAKDLAGR